MGSATVAVKTALNDNGFTYEYVSPDFVSDPTIASYRPGATPNDGAVFPDRSAYKAFVLFNQDSIRPEAYARIVDWAEHGMPLVIIGALPTRAQGGSDAAARDAQVLALTDRLQALVDDGNPAHHVTKVGSEAQVPAKLAAFGVRPSAGHSPVRVTTPSAGTPVTRTTTTCSTRARTRSSRRSRSKAPACRSRSTPSPARSAASPSTPPATVPSACRSRSRAITRSSSRS